MSKHIVMPARELEELKIFAEELKIFAAEIGTFPPFEEWAEIRQMIDPQNAVNTQLYWEWLGRSLDAFFSDKSDPLEDSGLNDTLQAVIQYNSNRYIDFPT